MAKILYIDAFGNAMTGIRASTLEQDSTVSVNGNVLPRARTFSDIAVGSGFCYENSNGLLEVAVNQGRADKVFNLHLGDIVVVEHRS